MREPDEKCRGRRLKSGRNRKNILSVSISKDGRVKGRPEFGTNFWPYVTRHVFGKKVFVQWDASRSKEHTKTGMAQTPFQSRVRPALRGW